MAVPFLSGAIEGFYGQPWTHAERVALFDHHLLRLRNRIHRRQPADRFPRPVQLGLQRKS
jgi:hypothetical protein